MSFDNKNESKVEVVEVSLNPFRAGRCLSTINKLSNVSPFNGLNPFRAGRCLSTGEFLSNSYEWNKVSIPFEQGDVFRHDFADWLGGELSLNPFRAGRCLSTA